MNPKLRRSIIKAACAVDQAQDDLMRCCYWTRHYCFTRLYDVLTSKKNKIGIELSHAQKRLQNILLENLRDL